MEGLKVWGENAKWVSFWLQDGTQTSTTVFADSYKDIEHQLRQEYGDDFGGVADWGTFDDDDF